jgi:lipopolysaccharide/colanic/teichoic acid biosynthesis glycosyltransferase
MIARLTKLGLDERPVHLHKIRTMYPFSEFVQEKLYKDHGLAELGKFRDDFRLSDYGRILRRYWLDEIPQLFDWLRGEVKLVGMRATSPHFMGLYPRDLYNLYIRTKPGLIPPIVDDPKAGFDDIVRIEFEYLRQYQQRPVSTDVKYLLKTLHDIFIKGVRSK